MGRQGVFMSDIHVSYAAWLLHVTLLRYYYHALLLIITTIITTPWLLHVTYLSYMCMSRVLGCVHVWHTHIIRGPSYVRMGRAVRCVYAWHTYIPRGMTHWCYALFIFYIYVTQNRTLRSHPYTYMQNAVDLNVSYVACLIRVTQRYTVFIYAYGTHFSYTRMDMASRAVYVWRICIICGMPHPRYTCLIYVCVTQLSYTYMHGAWLRVYVWHVCHPYISYCTPAKAIYMYVYIYIDMYIYIYVYMCIYI